jgi:hypothetical protein
MFHYDRNHWAEPLLRLWLSFKNKIAQEVPPKIALCEFDCRKAQCAEDEWNTCEGRLKSVGLQK